MLSYNAPYNIYWSRNLVNVSEIDSNSFIQGHIASILTDMLPGKLPSVLESRGGYCLEHSVFTPS